MKVVAVNKILGTVTFIGSSSRIVIKNDRITSVEGFITPGEKRNLWKYKDLSKNLTKRKNNLTKQNQLSIF